MAKVTKMMMSSTTMAVTMMMKTKMKMRTRLQERSNGQNKLSAGILQFLQWGTSEEQ
jgi:hypothetical protein